MVMFNVGDLAVYPAHGVGVIESIEQKVVGGVEQTFYIMRILSTNMTIMIPKASADRVGLRTIISDDEVSRVYDVLREREVTINTQTWNRRYREYMEKIKTGSIFEVAQVLRDLYILKADKPLSFGERKMLDTAKNLLVKELSIAKNTDEEEVEREIEAIFADTCPENASQGG